MQIELSSSVLFIQPIINFILLRPADTGPKCCLAALEFIVRQLKTDDPQVLPILIDQLII